MRGLPRELGLGVMAAGSDLREGSAPQVFPGPPGGELGRIVAHWTDDLSPLRRVELARLFWSPLMCLEHILRGMRGTEAPRQSDAPWDAVMITAWRLGASA